MWVSDERSSPVESSVKGGTKSTSFVTFSISTKGKRRVRLKDGGKGRDVDRSVPSQSCLWNKERIQ